MQLLRIEPYSKVIFADKTTDEMEKVVVYSGTYEQLLDSADQEGLAVKEQPSPFAW